MILRGIIAATAALALTATPVMAANNSAQSLAPATESVSGSELFGEGNVLVIVLAVVAVGLGLWAVIDDNDDLPASP